MIKGNGFFIPTEIGDFHPTLIGDYRPTLTTCLNNEKREVYMAHKTIQGNEKLANMIKLDRPEI